MLWAVFVFVDLDNGMLSSESVSEVSVCFV